MTPWFNHSRQMELCQLTPTGITISHLFLWWPGEMWALEGTTRPWRDLTENNSTQIAMVFSLTLGNETRELGSTFWAGPGWNPSVIYLIPRLLFVTSISGKRGLLVFQLIFTVQLKDLHGGRSFINRIYGQSQSQSITQTETQCSGAYRLWCSWKIVREEHGIIGREAELVRVIELFAGEAKLPCYCRSWQLFTSVIPLLIALQNWEKEPSSQTKALLHALRQMSLPIPSLLPLCPWAQTHLCHVARGLWFSWGIWSQENIIMIGFSYPSRSEAHKLTEVPQSYIKVVIKIKLQL